MDLAQIWLTLRAEPAAIPRPGLHQQAAGAGIEITVEQECQLVLPPTSLTADEVTVTVTSGRAGATGTVSIGANFNSANGSYQGPTQAVGSGQFTATDPVVQVRFAVLHPGFPVLGVGAEAVWDDGAPPDISLTYVQLQCNLPVWWRWILRVFIFFGDTFRGTRSSSTPRA